MIELVRTEIESLHEFFVEWFAGSCARDEARFEHRVSTRLSADFELIQPGGEIHNKSAISSAIRGGFGSNPAFRIAIRELRIRVQDRDWVVATYQEWQRNAHNSTPADNGRTSTVVFRRGEADSLEWFHVHETWLPPAAIAAGPYDF